MTSEAESSEQQKTPTAGAICWNALMTSDTAAAAPFYSSLFGWDSSEKSVGSGGDIYTTFTNDGKNCCGMMRNPQQGLPAYWLAYFSVDDVEASTSKVQSLGGQVIAPPTEIPTGKFSVVADPTGAVFGLYETARG